MLLTSSFIGFYDWGDCSLNAVETVELQGIKVLHSIWKQDYWRKKSTCRKDAFANRTLKKQQQQKQPTPHFKQHESPTIQATHPKLKHQCASQILGATKKPFVCRHLWHQVATNRKWLNENCQDTWEDNPLTGNHEQSRSRARPLSVTLWKNSPQIISKITHVPGIFEPLKLPLSTPSQQKCPWILKCKNSMTVKL